MLLKYTSTPWLVLVDVFHSVGGRYHDPQCLLGNHGQFSARPQGDDDDDASMSVMAVTGGNTSGASARRRAESTRCFRSWESRRMEDRR